MHLPDQMQLIILQTRKRRIYIILLFILTPFCVCCCQDLSDFARFKHPVVYFSLGTFARGTTMPLRYQKILLSVFGKLPYRVLWKFEGNKEHLPENIMIKKWMPQQDILGKRKRFLKYTLIHFNILGLTDLRILEYYLPLVNRWLSFVVNVV